MIFYLHYILLTSGLSGTSVLLAVYSKTYSDASQSETGTLLMAIPFVCLFIKPIFCSMADRRQSHHLTLMLALAALMLGFAPYLAIPFFPEFYTRHPRCSWWLQVVACLVGQCGLNVAWSLGDCLAVNHSQRTGVPFGRMRFMGTVSWGVYGFIIGQINEHPALPKYVPAFIILHASVALELLLLLLWDRKYFEMVDPLAGQTLALAPGGEKKREDAAAGAPAAAGAEAAGAGLAESVPSSLGGTLKIKPEAAKALLEALAAHDEELVQRLGQVQQQRASDGARLAECGRQKPPPVAERPHGRNPQLVLLKLILCNDGRALKYICVFTAFGAFMAPMNFFFVSLVGHCQERGYNFSQLTGAVLMSQAGIETLTFIVAPHLLGRLSRWSLLSAALAIMSLKYVFYAGWYYDAGVSPYWAVLAEWSHGIPYGLFCTIMADVSLMFANESRLFIPELRRLGYIAADTSGLSREALEAEERSIKMALRATMQALFSGFLDGLGMGVGSLLCGLFSDLYSYHIVWLIFATLTLSVFGLHLVAELSRSPWSDSYRPRAGTKAHEIMELSRAADRAQRERRNRPPPPPECSKAAQAAA